MIHELEQREVWTSADGRTQRLEVMSQDHRLNLKAWLERYARAIAESRREQLAEELQSISSELIDDASDAALNDLSNVTDAILEVAEADPARWIKQRPLYSALVNEIEAAKERVKKMRDTSPLSKLKLTTYGQSAEGRVHGSRAVDVLINHDPNDALPWVFVERADLDDMLRMLDELSMVLTYHPTQCAICATSLPDMWTLRCDELRRKYGT